jgi:sugar phosphate isomerase/epimerase
MIPVLQSALFPDTDANELAALATELGFDGVDLSVRGLPQPDDEQTLALLAAAGSPARCLTCDTTVPERLADWAALAAEADCRLLRCAPFDEDSRWVTSQLEALAEVAAARGVTILVPNHAASCFRDPAILAEFLREHDPAQLACLLSPDQLPRWREAAHRPWLERRELPPLGGVLVANYRWASELGSGNLRIWSAKQAPITHGHTPWSAWLARLRDGGFDGLFSFGDANLGATLGERLRVLRDDLRFVRRTWDPAAGRGRSRTHRPPQELPEF